MNITLKDGSILEYSEPKTAADICKDISMGLFRNACACKIDGEVKDLRTLITADASLEILTFEDEDGRKAYNHTVSHIMAQAVKRLYPEAKLTIGPAIENGFYYDFDVEETFSPEDLDKILAEMKKIVKENLPLERFELPVDEAIRLMEEKNEPYKIELIQEHAEKGEAISFYKQGEFTELCAGPHIFKTGDVKGNAFALISNNAAYWRGDSKNKALQRIYGIAFPKKDMLDEYLQKLEEAKLRDHRKIGKEMGLFMTDELVGRGMPMFLPKGYTLWRILEN